MTDLSDEGRILPPYGGETNCKSDSCRKPFSEDVGVYLHKNRETMKFLLLCGDCSLKAQQFDSLRYPLIPL